MSSSAGAAVSLNQAKASPRARPRLHLLPYGLVLPIILYEGFLIMYPIAQGIFGSFQQIELASNRPPTLIGLANYVRMLNDPEFWTVMQTTLIFTGLVLVVAISAGLFTALPFHPAFSSRSGSPAPCRQTAG